MIMNFDAVMILYVFVEQKTLLLERRWKDCRFYVGLLGLCSMASTLVGSSKFGAEVVLFEPRQAHLCLRAFRHDKF